MKVLYLLFFHFFFLVSTLGAQDLTIKWGKALEKGSASPLDILGEDDDAVFVAAHKGKKVFVQRFNKKSLGLELETEIVLPKLKGKKPLIQMLKLINDEVIIFFSNYYGNHRNLYIGTMSTNGKIDFQTQPVFEVPAESEKSITDFKFSTSVNKEFVLVSVVSSSKKKEIATLSSKVFNLDLDVVNEFDLVFYIIKQPESNKYETYEINDAITDNDGNIHLLYSKLLVTVIGESSTLTFREELHTLTHSIFDKNSYRNQIDATLIPTSNTHYLLHSAALVVNKEGDLCLVGFDMSVNLEKKYGSVFLLKVSGSSHQITHYTRKNIKPAHFNELAEDSAAYYVAPVGTLHQKINTIYLKEDGGFFIFAEQGGDGLGGTNHYNNIIFLDITNDGEIINVRGIQKNQTNLAAPIANLYTFGIAKPGTNHYYSYLEIFKNGNILFIFNDHPKNIDKKAYDKPMADIISLVNPKNGIPVMVVMDREGKLSDRKAVDLELEDVHLRPAIYYKLNDGDFIIYGNVKKSEMLGRLTVN